MVNVDLRSWACEQGLDCQVRISAGRGAGEGLKAEKRAPPGARSVSWGISGRFAIQAPWKLRVRLKLTPNHNRRAQGCAKAS